MKLLFCGPFLDFSGFAHASRNFLLALLSDNRIEVSARPLFYDRIDSHKKSQVHPAIKAAMDRSIGEIDIVVQMTTCNQEAVPVSGVKNILYSFFESDRIPKTWADKANQFDRVLVPCEANKTALVRSGVKTEILVCVPPCDPEDYVGTDKYEISGAQKRTVFYNICQLSQKKGVDLLLRSYYAAFAHCPNEVLLVLKTYIGMSNRSDDMKIIKQFIERIKNGCRIPGGNYPPVLVIPDTLSDTEIHSLHRACDIYVMPSRAEGFGIPSFDALCHGNILISHNQVGLASYVNKNNSLVYGGCWQKAFDMPHSDPTLYTGMETWFEPSTHEMSQLMYWAHTNKNSEVVSELSRNALQLKSKFSFEHMSERIVTLCLI